VRTGRVVQQARHGVRKGTRRGLHQKPRHAADDALKRSAAGAGDDWSLRSHGLERHHAKVLVLRLE